MARPMLRLGESSQVTNGMTRANGDPYVVAVASPMAAPDYGTCVPFWGKGATPVFPPNWCNDDSGYGV